MKNVYLGNTTYYGDGTLPTPNTGSSIVAVESNKLIVSTFDVKPTSGSHPEEVKKIDLLFYNRVGSGGKIVSSLVYIGDVTNSEDTTSFMYRPKFMYRNSAFELGLTLPDDNQFQYFNYIRQNGTPRPSFVTAPIEDIKVNDYPAPVVADTFPMLDGWYTIVSAGIIYNPASDEQVTLRKGQFVMFPDKGGEMQLYVAVVDSPKVSVDSNWHLFKTIVTSGDIINNYGTLVGIHVNDDLRESPSSQWRPIMARQEFFVKENFNSVYKKLMHGFIDNYGMQYGEAFKQIRVKDRIISSSAMSKDFVEAQLFLQSSEFIILEYTEL